MEIMRFMNNNNNNNSNNIHNQNQESKSGSTKKKITTMSSEQSKRSSSNNNNNNNNIPDLTDFMNDMFFGTGNRKKSYNLTGDGDRGDRDRDRGDRTDEDESLELSPRRSVSGKMTQEWLDEARRMVASSSPTRCDSPTRLVGAPRFAAVTQGRSPSSSILDRRDPLSRSARRYRAVESFSGEIITKTTKHGRNKSETFMATDTPDSSTELSSPAATVHHWFSNILKPPNPTPPPQPQPQQLSTTALSRRQSFPRQSRFKSEDRPSSPRPQGIPAPPGRTVKGPSPSIGPKILSPPRSLVESAQRRSISSSTCSTEKIIYGPKKPILEKNDSPKPDLGINGFLRDQRAKIMDGDSKAKIVLSGPSNRSSSMVAAICYAWLLENRKRKEKTKEEEECAIVPVVNLKREAMWKLKDVSWLFHHLALDVSSLLFADEVNLEDLMMEGKLSMVVIGQDVLRINGEVRSQCTILTDNYCEEAYDLLQDPMLKKLLLAAILLDTQNLNSSPPQVSMTRDTEAVQLLLVGSAPNYRNTLFDQLTQDQRDEPFLEAMVQSYGKPPNEDDNETDMDDKVSEQKSASSHHVVSVQNSNTKSYDSKNTKPNKVSQKSDKPSSLVPQARPATTQVKETTNPDPSRAKNKFSLAKWFGFGSK